MINLVFYNNDEASRKKYVEEASKQYDLLLTGDSEKYKGFLGWIDLPKNVDEELIQDIKKTAEEIRDKCDTLVVVGIGGSYEGAHGVIEALGGGREGYPKILFAGYDTDPLAVKRIVDIMDKEETCLLIISKSMETMETLAVHAILDEKMKEKYGEQRAIERTYLVTRSSDKKAGKVFTFPENIGGRYSVLSVAGLLPVAAAGYDIEALIDGAKKATDEEGIVKMIAYTATRFAMRDTDKSVEIFACYGERMKGFASWLRQLFAESEGKDNNGAFPATLCYPEDMHSVGQFLQGGKQIFYENILAVKEDAVDVVLPNTSDDVLAGKKLSYVNDSIKEAVVGNHRDAGIPIIEIELEKMKERELGYLIYFFEMAAAVSSMMAGVNPFDQPGVDRYKRELIELISRNEK